LKRDKGKRQGEMQELQELLDAERKKNSALRAENGELTGGVTAGKSQHAQSQTLVAQLEQMKDELEAELEASEESRASLKADLGDAAAKITELEEELYESKTIQLELLENLKQAEEKLEAYITEHEGDVSDLHASYESRTQWAQEKIFELQEILSKVEHTQVIYIAHKPDKIDRTLANFINKYPERKKMTIMFLRESEGVYQFGQKRVYVKVERGETILVRVGGGFMGIEEFIRQYTPEEVEKIQRKDVFNNFQNKL